jgi:hypothetical protein
VAAWGLLIAGAALLAVAFVAGFFLPKSQSGRTAIKAAGLSASFLGSAALIVSGALYLFATYFFNLVSQSSYHWGVTSDFSGVSEFAFIAATLSPLKEKGQEPRQ